MNHPPAPVTDTALLHRLRSVALRNPERAVEHLLQLTDAATVERATGPVGVDVRILLAEARQRSQPPGPDPRLRHVTAALDACHDAAQAAGALHPVDQNRIVIALAVAADIAVWAGLPQAVPACDSYVVAAADCDPPDESRIVFAGALRAVAIYQHVDCRAGSDLMNTARDLHPAPCTAAVKAMFNAAAYAMRHSCREGGYQRAVGHPPPLPGGLLHPTLGDPAPDHLAHRIRAHLAAHTC